MEINEELTPLQVEERKASQEALARLIAAGAVLPKSKGGGDDHLNRPSAIVQAVRESGRLKLHRASTVADA